MYKDIGRLVIELCKLGQETEYVEFKHNNCNPDMIGQDISALANSALVADHVHAYMIWGVDDSSHAVIGTSVRLREQRKGGEELENWLRHSLSDNADFEIESAEIDGAHVEILIIKPALGTPVSFCKQTYIRIGSYTKKIGDYPERERALWDKLCMGVYEDAAAVTGLTLNECFSLLDADAYFDNVGIPRPDDALGREHYLLQDNILKKQDDGLYSITNMGALLFALDLSAFPRLGRKSLRLIYYENESRMSIRRQETLSQGYAVSLPLAFDVLSRDLPMQEETGRVRLTVKAIFPQPAIREAIANALIHQDFYISGAGPVVEVFPDKVEVTNPGMPLVDVARIVDSPPRSRNESLSRLMRRMGMCEELGRGWDRMVISCEMQRCPSPRIEAYSNATKVCLFTTMDYAKMSQEDRLWSLYLHACVRYVERKSLTNSSLRERFGLPETYSGSMSRLIKEAQSKGLIVARDAGTSYRYMEYVPRWVKEGL